MMCRALSIAANRPLGGLLQLPVGIVGARPAGDVSGQQVALFRDSLVFVDQSQVRIIDKIRGMAPTPA